MNTSVIGPHGAPVTLCRMHIGQPCEVFCHVSTSISPPSLKGEKVTALSVPLNDVGFGCFVSTVINDKRCLGS